jgi:hypothetical protein
MAEEKFCQGCKQKNRCQEVYKYLSKMEGPPVIFQVLIAFLLPIAVFIGCLGASESILAKVTNSKELQTVFGFLVALVVTSICILITRAISIGLIKNN